MSIEVETPGESGEGVREESSFGGFPDAAPKDQPPFPSLEDTVKPKRKPGRPPKANLKAALNQQFVLVGTVVFAFNQYDGQVILAGADNLASALDNLASENPSIEKALRNLLTVSAWSGVLMAAASMTIPIAANHGLVPVGFAPMFGMPMPDVEGVAVEPDA